MGRWWQRRQARKQLPIAINRWLFYENFPAGGGWCTPVHNQRRFWRAKVIELVGRL